MKKGRTAGLVAASLFCLIAFCGAGFLVSFVAMIPAIFVFFVTFISGGILLAIPLAGFGGWTMMRVGDVFWKDIRHDWARQSVEIVVVLVGCGFVVGASFLALQPWVGTAPQLTSQMAFYASLALTVPFAVAYLFTRWRVMTGMADPL